MARYQFLRFPEGRTKAVTFSYDDGVHADIRLAETMDRYGIKGTFNICAGWLNDSDPFRLSAEEIQKYILDAGHEVAVHGNFHRAPGEQRTIAGIRDVLDCRIGLEKAFGRIIRGMAYPDCGITRFCNQADYPTIRQYLQSLDIAYARTLGGDNDRFRMPEDWYAWMPTTHHSNPKARDYARSFVETPMNGYVANQEPKLFYLWGHSYEFDRDDNWDLLEELCGILGNHEDIWYATNMEIYTYTQAYHALEYSADGSIVYNPTRQDVWFSLDGTVYCIRAGETLKLEL